MKTGGFIRPSSNDDGTAVGATVSPEPRRRQSGRASAGDLSEGMSQCLASLPPDPIAGDFSAVLQSYTKDVHRSAERTGFIADLLHARVTPAGYALFLRNLVPVYAALEAALPDFADHPLAGAFADPRLCRRAALEADLRVLAGESWAALPCLAEATGYAVAIEANASDPYRLAAHGYVRYMGDLSGGQILKTLLARNLGLNPDALTFYDFPDYAHPALPKAAIRAALNTLSPTATSAQQLCASAKEAFLNNIALSEAVQRACAG